MENLEAKNINEVKAFLLIEDQLYIRMVDEVLAKYVDESFRRKLLEEMHSKFCGLDGSTLTKRIQTLGYF